MCIRDRDHPFAGREVSVEEILKETLIHRENGSGTLAILEEKLLEHNESLERLPRMVTAKIQRIRIVW